jgi:trehalose synthase
MSIENGVQGVLVDPSDLSAFGGALRELLHAREHAAALGQAAHERARDRFLPPDYLSANLEVVAAVAGGELSSL